MGIKRERQGKQGKKRENDEGKEKKNRELQQRPIGQLPGLLYKPARREISGGGPQTNQRPQPDRVETLYETSRSGVIKERLEREAVELVKETTSKRPASESRYIQP